MAVYSTVPVPTIDGNGYHMPDFADVLSAHKSDYARNYGLAAADLSDAADQDVEWVTIEAFALQETFALGLAIYRSFSPSTAFGEALSSVVKQNGIAREKASYSTATVTVTGQALTVLVGQTATDGARTWTLPSPIVIPLSGSIDVTATCSILGAVAVDAGGLSLGSITKGLQSITNAAAATPGAPVETDPELRQRQATSTELPAVGIAEGILGAILALPNVTRARVYDNDAATTDARGIPGHSISAVVDGGDATAIATAIALRKGEAGTYGTASAVVPSGAAQIPRTVYFFRPSEPPISVIIAVKALTGFTVDVSAAIQAAVASYINGLGIGDGTLNAIDVGRLYGPALLGGTAYAGTFTITSILVARDSGTPGTAAVAIAFNEAPTTTTGLIAVNAS